MYYLNSKVDLKMVQVKKIKEKIGIGGKHQCQKISCFKKIYQIR